MEHHSKEAYRILCKAYTSALYEFIGEALTTGNFCLIESYLTVFFENHQKYSNDAEVRYPNYELPVYRGASRYNPGDLKLNAIRYWPNFSSTSRDYDAAFGFARGVCLYKIYLTNKNSPVSHISLPSNDKGWSYYPYEEELTLLPFFHFMVLEIEKKEGEGEPLTITIAEMPY